MAERVSTAAIDWEDVRFFAAVARHGSLSAAARALSVNHATVARRIAALEQSVGTRLIGRTPSGYALTRAGERALKAADGMGIAATALARLEPEAALTGLVRITATPAFAEMFLMPRIGALLREHPALDLEIVADRRTFSLQRHQSDIALRLGRPEKGEILARRIGHVSYRFYGTRAWRERLRQGAAPAFVGFDEAGAQFSEAAWLTRHFAKARVVVRCNDLVGQIAAVRAGCGIGMLPAFLAAGDAALVQVDLREAPPRRELWMLTRPDAQETPRIRVVSGFLLELVRNERGVLDGA